MPNPIKGGPLSRVGSGPKPTKTPDHPLPNEKKPAKNPWANPKFRKVAGLQLVLDVTKYVRDSEVQEDYELALQLNKYAEEILREIQKLEKGMTKAELAELELMDQPPSYQPGRHPLRPK
jgi:hypothetical protein